MNKRRFTWLDGLCILLVLALAAGAFWFFTKDSGTEDTASEPKNYILTLRFTQATTDPYDFYEVGDTIHFFTRTQELGTITSLELLDWVKEDYNAAKGEYVTYVDPLRKQIQMQVLVEGSIQNGTFTVNGEELSIGGVFYPQTDTTRSSMTIWDIEEVAA